MSDVQQPAAPSAPPPYNPATRTNGLAIASLICSLVGVSIVGVVLGHVALSQINRRQEEGKVLAIIGLIVGYAGCLAWLILWAVVIFGIIYSGSAIYYFNNYDYGNY